MIRARLLAFGLILIIGVLLVVLLVAGTVLSALERWSESWIGLWGPLLRFADLALSISIVTVLFAVIYKVLPRARVDWRDVWVGSLVTSLLFALGKFALGEYLAHSSLASSFGAAGSLIVLTVWVYYSAQIFLLGAEFTWLYAHRHGSRSHTGSVEPNAAPEIPHRSATDTKASSPVPAWENA